MRVLLIYRHNRRCIAHFYRRAFQQLGHHVTTVGPWDESEPFGTDGRRPIARLTWCTPLLYDYSEVHDAASKHGIPCVVGDNIPPFDLRVLIDSGDRLQVHGIPYPWLHHALEGTNLDWSDTPYKSAGLMQNVTVPNVAYIPGGFDAEWHWRGYTRDARNDEYDLIQVAHPREARRFIWDHVRAQAPDLNTLFTDLWGSLYCEAYRKARATYVCSTQDFITMRVWEAMASGCVVIADRTPAMLAMFRDGEHFIGYDSEPSPHGERVPPLDFLLATARRLQRHPGEAVEMADRAHALVQLRHSWKHRAQAMIDLVQA